MKSLNKIKIDSHDTMHGEIDIHFEKLVFKKWLSNNNLLYLDFERY